MSCAPMVLKTVTGCNMQCNSQFFLSKRHLMLLQHTSWALPGRLFNTTNANIFRGALTANLF